MKTKKAAAPAKAKPRRRMTDKSVIYLVPGAPPYREKSDFAAYLAKLKPGMTVAQAKDKRVPANYLWYMERDGRIKILTEAS